MCVFGEGGGGGGSEHGSEKKNVAQLHLIHQSSHMEMT